MKPISPVVFGLEPHETSIGCKGDVAPLKVLRSPDGRMMSRWELTDEERQQIAAGGDVFLTIWTFNEGMNPVALQVMQADIDPDIIRIGLDLDDAMALRMLQEDVNEANQALQERVNRLGAARQRYIEKLNERTKAEGVAADGSDKGNNDQGTHAG